MHIIEIPGVINARAHGRPEAWLVRSASLEALDADGAAALRGLAVARVLDLREPEEAESAPTPRELLESHGIEVHRCTLYGRTPPTTGRIEDVYRDLLGRRGPALTTAVHTIAESPGATLVHCSAGKDRTGLVVALALSAAGVDRSAVIEDYAVSGPAIADRRRPGAIALAAQHDASLREEILRLQLDSPASAMAAVLADLDRAGGPVAYLRRNGLTAHEITQLTRRSDRDGASR